MNKHLANWLKLTGILLVVAGCTQTQNIHLNTQIQEQLTQAQPPEIWAADQAVDANIAQNWSLIIKDAKLLFLIEEALVGNPSLRSSAERVARSQAFLRQSGSLRLPRLDLSAAGFGTTPLESPTFTERYSDGVDVSWEVDLWGRIGFGVQASQFDLAASIAFYNHARDALIGETARTYIAAIEAKNQQQLNVRTVAALRDILRIVEVRRKLGAASKREVVLAQSDLATAQDGLEVAMANFRLTIRALEVLLGRYPAAKLTVPDTFPVINPVLAHGRPADILRRRPDILIAENELRSAFSAIDIETASRWPRLILSSDISGVATNPEGLFDPASLAFSLGLRLANSLFDGGLTKGRIEAAHANGRQALAKYGQTVLDAFQQVENQLDTKVVLERRLEFTETSAIAARETLLLAETQYKEGAIDLLDVLNFRQRSFQAERTLLFIQSQKYTARINLYLTLGGTKITKSQSEIPKISNMITK